MKIGRSYVKSVASVTFNRTVTMMDEQLTVNNDKSEEKNVK
jgi:hypothetical protein